MTTPGYDPAARPAGAAANATLFRAAVWVAIGALIAAAIVCVVMVMIGSSGGIVPRAFLTILLMVAFAGVAMLETRLAPGRVEWVALTSMTLWVVALLCGAVLIWLPVPDVGFEGSADAGLRVFWFALIIGILQLAFVHVRLFTASWRRHRTVFTTTVAWITIVLVGLLSLMLILPLLLHEWLRFHDLYWRLVVSVAILAAVGTALVPLVNALFAPRREATPPAPSWPRYADGMTPLPARPDGTPDWRALRTGPPSMPAAAPAGRWVARPPVPRVPVPPGPDFRWAAPAPVPYVAPPTAPAASLQGFGAPPRFEPAPAGPAPAESDLSAMPAPAFPRMTTPPAGLAVPPFDAPAPTQPAAPPPDAPTPAQPAGPDPATPPA